MKCQKCGKENEKSANYCLKCGNPLERKHKKISTKTIIIFVLIPIILISIISISSKIKERKAIENYKIIVADYLKDKYQMEFIITPYAKGHKAREFSIDHSTGRCGHYSYIKQYVYKVNDGETSEDFYVTVWESKRNGEYEINEVNGTIRNERDTSYETQRKNKKLIDEINPQINMIVSKRYTDYTITNMINKGKIIIKINSSIKDEINDNYQTLTSLSEINMIDETTDAYVTFDIVFNDYTYNDLSKRTINIIKDFFKLVENVNRFCNGFDDCSITYGPNTSFTVNLPSYYINKDHIDSSYSSLYNHLQEYIAFLGHDGVSVQTSAYIKFKNKNVWVSSYKTLEEIMKED